MNHPRRVYWVLSAIVVFLVVVALATSWAYVIRARDNQHEADVRNKERTEQLAVLCTRVNAVVNAAEQIVNPPGAVQYPQRVAALKELEGARCDPNSFHLTK